MFNVNVTNNGKLINLTIGRTVDVFISYRTPIAYYDYKAGKLVIRENDWSNTTGKHLNDINPDHSIRISGSEFMKKYNKYFKKFAN